MTLIYINKTPGRIVLKFSEGGQQTVMKIVPFNGGTSEDFERSVVRAAREAERDFLFARYGSEWRTHDTHPGSFWSDRMSVDEKPMVLQAAMQ